MCVCVCVCVVLAHAVMEADMSQDPKSVSWRLRRVDGVSCSPCLTWKVGGDGCPSSDSQSVQRERELLSGLDKAQPCQGGQFAGPQTTIQMLSSSRNTFT